jgi:type VI secretion system protein ImpG
MSFNKYYKDELTFLTELGREFAEENPQLAPFLAERGNDPDVERLLEGFAFLAGRLQQKLDDELPELAHGLITLLWPHYLRPVPSMSVLEFKPHKGLSEIKRIPRGVEVDSDPIEGTHCRFRTCYDVDLIPLEIAAVEAKRTAAGGEVEIQFNLDPRASLEDIGLKRLRFFLHGESYITTNLLVWVFRYLDSISITNRHEPTKIRFRLPANSVSQVGFDPSEALLHYPPNAFPGYRLIQEYFALPEKFHFFDIFNLESVAQLPDQTGFRLTLHFSKPLEENVRLERRHFALNCTPIVNLFDLDGDPIRLDHERTSYRVRPSATPSAHYEIFDVTRVEGFVPGSSQRRVYEPFESFKHSEGPPDEKGLYYQRRIRPAVVSSGIDTYLAFVDSRTRDALPPTETISIELVCSNRKVPEELKVGDIHRHTGTSPEFADFRNLTGVTPNTSPPTEAGLQWRLISNLALNHLSLTSPEALKEILVAYDFRAYFDRTAQRQSKQRLLGIEGIREEPADRLVQGLPVRGRRTILRLRESRFGGEGEMFVFASVLNEFLALYSSINSFSELVVEGIEHGEIYHWPVILGPRPTL